MGKSEINIMQIGRQLIGNHVKHWRTHAVFPRHTNCLLKLHSCGTRWECGWGICLLNWMENWNGTPQKRGGGRERKNKFLFITVSQLFYIIGSSSGTASQNSVIPNPTSLLFKILYVSSILVSLNWIHLLLACHVELDVTVMNCSFVGTLLLYGRLSSYLSAVRLVQSGASIGRSRSKKSKPKLLYDWRSVSQYVCLDVGHPFGARNQILLFPLFCRKIALLFVLGRPLWREDGSAVCNAICQWSESLLLSHLRLQSSLSVASYNSQGIIRLHTGHAATFHSRSSYVTLGWPMVDHCDNDVVPEREQPH
jgi:hypothetical protein